MIFQAQIGLQTGRLQQTFYQLQQWGLIDFLLPFLLFFAVIFAILQKVHLFGQTENKVWKADRRMNGIISLIFALLITVPHVMGLYPPQTDPVIILINILPSSAILLIGIALVVILSGLAGEGIPTLVTNIAGLIAIVIVGYFFLSAIFPDISFQSGPLADPGLQALLIILLVFGLVVYFIIKEPATGQGQNLFERLMGTPRGGGGGGAGGGGTT